MYPCTAAGPAGTRLSTGKEITIAGRSKGLRKEVREIFGDEVLIQRCQQQK